MKTVLITGANTGLGKEAASQFSQRPEVGEVVITARDSRKGEEALAELRDRVGRAAALSLVQLDTTLPESVAAAAEQLPAIDIAVLNAGGVGGAAALEPSGYGVANITAANLTGHADLVQRLVADGKLRERVVMVSSEAARGIKLLRVQPPPVDTTDLEAIARVMRGEDEVANSDQLSLYAHIKLFSSLWASAFARTQRDLTVVSVSPGSTRGTDAARHMPPPMNKLMPLMMKYVMPIFGASHSLETGVQRYLDVALGDDIVDGGFYASPPGKIRGELVDQREHYAALASVDAQDTVLAAVDSATLTVG